MTTIDDFFSNPTEFQHPRVRNWKTRLAEPGTSATMEVSRSETEVGQFQPDMNLQFTKDGHPLPLETVPWDDELNGKLIRLAVRAVSAEQEAERFALGLRVAMRKTEREFGDGYFNAVLVDLITDSDLTRYPDIAEVLKHSTALSANRESKRYNPCREMIADAISGRARELTERLGYSQDEAKQILVSRPGRSSSTTG
ncbi:MAG: hypothetical protein ACLQNE_16205 [Thermoguttaceae bacterium]